MRRMAPSPGRERTRPLRRSHRPHNRRRNILRSGILRRTPARGLFLPFPIRVPGRLQGRNLSLKHVHTLLQPTHNLPQEVLSGFHGWLRRGRYRLFVHRTNHSAETQGLSRMLRVPSTQRQGIVSGASNVARTRMVNPIPHTITNRKRPPIHIPGHSGSALRRTHPHMPHPRELTIPQPANHRHAIVPPTPPHPRLDLPEPHRHTPLTAAQFTFTQILPVEAGGNHTGARLKGHGGSRLVHAGTHQAIPSIGQEVPSKCVVYMP